MNIPYAPLFSKYLSLIEGQWECRPTVARYETPTGKRYETPTGKKKRLLTWGPAHGEAWDIIFNGKVIGVFTVDFKHENALRELETVYTYKGVIPGYRNPNWTSQPFQPDPNQIGLRYIESKGSEARIDGHYGIFFP